MMSTAQRIYLIAIVVFAVYGVQRFLAAQTAPPAELLLPDWTFRELPYDLGDWRGEDVKLDPVIAAAVGADIIVDRSYRKDDGVPIMMHTAVFRDPKEAILHSPLNCYRGAGWVYAGRMQETIKVSEAMSIPIELVVWEKDHEKALVAFWYQVGDQVLFDRWDLGKLRIAMRHRTKWPATIKVMAQISAPNVDRARVQLLEFVDLVAKWQNDPKHVKYYEEPSETK